MAKIVLTSFGTLGDMFPFLRVGQYLKAAGHDVVFATSSYYAEIVEKHGLTFHACGPSEDELQIRLGMTIPQIMQRSMHPWRGIEFAARHVVLPTLARDYQQLLDACKDADLLISHVYSFAAPLVHQRLNIAWTNLILQPMALLSTHDPSVLNDYLPIEKMANIVGPSVYGSILQWALRRTDSWFSPLWDLIHQEGLLPLKGHPFSHGGWTSTPMYALFDEMVWRTQKGLPSNLKHCGYSHWDGGEDLSESTLSWIERHPRPLIFTLGSSAVHHARHFYDAAIAAADHLNMPAILLAGNHQFFETSRRIHVLPWASHRQLFPYGSLIIHQGGSGTCCNALYSGKPQIIYAFGNDQPDNAQRLQDLGVAIRKTARRIDVADMTRTIAECSNDAMLIARAKGIARILSPVDGAYTAAQTILQDYLTD